MSRMLYLAILIAMVLALVVSPAVAAPVDPAGKAARSGGASNNYVVRMVGAPVVAYDGGIPGYPATKPDKGQKVNPNDPKVVKYVGFLEGRHNDALNKAGGRLLYHYSFSFNGFAAELTEEQVAKLTTDPNVLAIDRDQIYEVDTSSTPAFLGLDASGGLWEQLGGVDKAGDGIIIGIIDSGIWPESSSFTDRTAMNGNGSKSGKLGFQQIPGWHGKCTPGEMFNASLCNQKLIGAQWFNASWGGDAALEAQRPWEFMSVRDYNGHGTHTASTSGGNNGVATTGPAAVFGAISGIAPHARIAAYKALWSTQAADTASGSTSDLVAAIDQAVADGVDVINYSISGTSTNFRDPAEIAFMYAAQTGIFVAASAGNSGPTTATVAHPSPWITTVAAGTHNRNGEGTVTLGNGATYTGASVATPVSAPLIDSIAAGLPGADPTQLALCYGATDGAVVLDPAKVAGKIVICDRGVTARVNKSLAVQEAGGVGMILTNTSVNSLNADFHFVPTVHLQSTDRAAVKAYAALPGATATINQATIIYNAPAPLTASFSSRGPLRASGDLLKPDVIAPGQDILAAVAPPGQAGRDFNLLSGTSMSSPHVAGLAALLKHRHPDWSPMAIKSALMTTAGDVLDGPNTNPVVIFRQGAGHVKPNSAADPGLVFDSGQNDWLAFICATQPQGLEATVCGPLWSMGYSKDPSDFNVASIAIAELAGTQAVTRIVTNVGSQAETYTASYTGLTGITVALPGSMTIAKGATQSFSVAFTTAGAALNSYVGGQLTLTGDKGHVVRIPVVIKPVALAAPAQVSGSYSVMFGYNGPFTATARGLVPATTFTGSVMTDPDGSFEPEVNDYTAKFDVVIPMGTTYARFSLFDANVSPAGDLDLNVYNSVGTLIGSSGGGTSAEEVNLSYATPTSADTPVTVWVHGFETGNPSTFTLFTWALGTAAAGNMMVSAPASATLGATGAIDLSFSGLTAGTKYLGSVVYGGAAGMPNPTIVRVDP